MSDKKRNNIKGIRIRSLNIAMLALSLALFIVVFWITIRVANGYRETVRTTENYIRWEKTAHEIHVVSDFLTEEARLYTQTHNLQHALNYVKELVSTKSREKAIDNLAKFNIQPEFISKLDTAIEYSNNLAKMELYAIRLVAEGMGLDMKSLPEAIRNISLSEEDHARPADDKLKIGREMLFSPEYARAKSQILGSLTQAISLSLDETRTEQQHSTEQLGRLLNEQRIALIALCVLNCLTFLMIIILIVRPLKLYAKCIREDKMFQLVEAYEFNNLALTYNDIFAIKEHQDRMLKYKAEHDPLTSLLNRSAFDSIKNILEHEQNPIGLVLIDVDKFKSINDTYGHMTGDLTLCRVANMIHHSFRSDDFCIRLGGDEFAVLVIGSPDIMAEIILSKIQSMNKLLQQPEGEVPPTSLSVGVAFSEAGYSDKLYSQADRALYRVKESGRCGCAFYDPAIDSEDSAIHDRRRK